jgi:hypothetical protein
MARERKPRIYELEVEGRGIVPDSNHLTQMLKEIESERFMAWGKNYFHKRNFFKKYLAGVDKYNLTATDPWALNKR